MAIAARFDNGYIADMTDLDKTLKGKAMVVTGANSGVGLATCQLAKDAGATVTGLDLALDQLTSAGIAGSVLDVSQSLDWQSFAESIASVDFLVLNAGIQSAPPSAPLQDYAFKHLDLSRYRRLMGVNVDGVVLGLHHLLGKMPRGSSIVVTCSLAGITPYDVDPLYAMSKHAVTGLVRSLRKELGAAGIRINAICPGGIDTALIPHDQRQEAETNNIPFMRPEDIGAEILRLLTVEESGQTWAKVSAEKPAWIVHPPGKRS